MGKFGFCFFLEPMTAPASAEFAKQVEKNGYKVLWIPEAVGREPFPHASYLPSHTYRPSIATGIANNWARDAVTMASASKTVAGLFGHRFLRCIGVNHKPLLSN